MSWTLQAMLLFFKDLFCVFLYLLLLTDKQDRGYLLFGLICTIYLFDTTNPNIICAVFFVHFILLDLFPFSFLHMDQNTDFVP